MLIRKQRAWSLGWKDSVRDPARGNADDPQECEICFKKALYRVPVQRSVRNLGFCKEHYKEAAKLTSMRSEVYAAKMKNWKEGKEEMARAKAALTHRRAARTR